MHAARRLLPIPLILAALATAAGCGPKVDLTKGLEVVDVTTGWFDAGQVAGSNKIVPTITFKLKNVSDQKLKALHTNVVFREVGKPNEEWGSGFKIVRGSEGLAPGETTEAITLRSLNGLTAAQPRADMLVNKAFRDAKADVYAKYSSTQWVRLREVAVERHLTGN
jgi:hypothetical protein